MQYRKYQLVAFPDCVEKEGSSVAQTAGHVIHVQVGLNMACYEVRRCDEIG